MKISRNSKWSRYTYHWSIERSNNICDYVRDIVKASLLYLFFIGFIAGALLLLVPAIFVFPYYVWALSTGLTIMEELNDLQEVWLVFGFFEYVIGAYIALHFGIKRAVKKRPTHPTENSKVIRTWWKARKEKICPLIEWED
jgi:hypothetical protein